jgi:ABC-type proline/glycine betaine transport system permease subunit
LDGGSVIFALESVVARAFVGAEGLGLEAESEKQGGD